MTTVPVRGGRCAELRGIVVARRRLAGLLSRAGWPLVLATAVCDLALGVLPVVFVVATSAVVGHVPEAAANGAAWTGALSALVVASLAFAGQQVLVPVQAGLGEVIARRIDGEVLDQLMAAALRAPGIGGLEDQRQLDLLSRARRELERGFQSPGKGCAGMLHLIARVTQLAGFAALVGIVFSWLAAVALLATVLAFRYGHRRGLHRFSNLFRANAAVRREGDYLRDLAMGATAAKEIRIFGTHGWLTDRYRTSYLSWLLPSWWERRRIMVRPFYGYTAFGVLAVAAVLGALGAASLSTAEIALVVQAVMGALRLAEHYPEADLQTEYGADAYDAVLAFERGMTGDEPAGGGTGPVPHPRSEIAFRGLAFGYPGAARPVFTDLDLTLRAGRCTAVIGVNGVGKTTLVKLLTRLYEPDRGVITADGVDIRRFAVDDWRARLAVVFQDFVRHERSARDNIGLGAVEHLDDEDGIRAAAGDAGVLPALDALPSGLDTPLAGHVTGGADLSGGQWQRVALARALFRLRHEGALLVLDEPTASLDVRAEARFFEEFQRVAAGRTSLLISHRFSTVRHADHIVVIAGGEVVEEGTHDELLSLGGRYAELFHLQAGQFGDDVAAHGEREAVG
ncbi:ATP-binding cassette, subfamily B [Lentzea fradiae]|uniref:ATP-binding cassette, subfamily B n=1 Tax=Lentzea fradiae TaxID=200378 RepID=A0A1G8BGC5_9PSEU|nr:ABC transporter ATP-binding protein [Lentzea fradiae]SDH31640.1 ATP-binding cassette, subfamily B [Lentzea fradiae]